MNKDILHVLYQNYPTQFWSELLLAFDHLDEAMNLTGWNTKDTAAAVQSIVRLIEDSVEATSYSLSR